MTPRAVRRFTIADGMILVVASAVSAAMLRSFMPGFAEQLDYLNSFVPDPWGFWRVTLWLSGPGSCVVIPWMAALIVIRLRQPRPRRVRFAMQPGFIACVIVLASLVPGMLWYATIAHRPGFQGVTKFEQVWSIITHWTTSSVVGAWLALVIARRWRPERSWIDRMGRILGAYWVVLFVGVLAYQSLQKLLDVILRGGGS